MVQAENCIPILTQSNINSSEVLKDRRRKIEENS
jgi:hypothetical protein